MCGKRTSKFDHFDNFDHFDDEDEEVVEQDYGKKKTIDGNYHSFNSDDNDKNDDNYGDEPEPCKGQLWL